MNSHKYKIGQKVRHINGRDYFIVGIKSGSYISFGETMTTLIIHEEKSVPSRMGYKVTQNQLEVLNDV